MPRRVLVLFLLQLLLRALVAEANHLLAPMHVYLFLGAVFLLYGTLALPFREGLLLATLGGLLHDAFAPVTFGTHAVLFAFAHVLLFRLRDRVPRDDTLGRVVIALLTNLTLYLIFSFVQIGGSAFAGSLWPRLIADLLWSQLALALVTPWFVGLQARALVLARAEPQPAS